MLSKHMKLVLLCYGMLVSALVYWQWQFYRTPLIVSDADSIETSILPGGPQQQAIPSIENPVFESVVASDQYLDDKGLGLAVLVNGNARFYPYQILVWHMIVNETFGGKPLLVTFSPLTESGIVFERTDTFDVSGNVLDNHLLMIDQSTQSLWSQLLGKAIVGDAKGNELTRYPSMTISWNVFKQEFPEGQVLSRSTGVDRDYTQNPYGDYESSHAVYFPIRHDDGRLATKTRVFGIMSQDGQIAFIPEAVQTSRVVNSKVGSEPIVVWWDDDLETARAYRRIDPNHQELTFRQEGTVIVDDQTGSVWNTQGEAVSGSLRGNKLSPIPVINAFWFAWSSVYPQTDVWGIAS